MHRMFSALCLLAASAVVVSAIGRPDFSDADAYHLGEALVACTDTFTALLGDFECPVETDGDYPYKIVTLSPATVKFACDGFG